MMEHFGVLAVVLLIATAVGAQDTSSNYLLTGHSTPLASSFAHQFFTLASQSAELANRTNTQVIQTYEDRNYDDELCDRDINLIRDSINNLEEWALECKHVV